MNWIMIVTGAICLQLMACSAAWAQPKLPFAPTERELLLLPEGCRAILKGGPAAATAAQQWLPGVEGKHHFCFGLNFMNRARFTMDKTEKRFNLQSAIGEFNYPLNNSQPNVSGLEEVRGLKGAAEKMLKLL